MHHILTRIGVFKDDTSHLKYSDSYHLCSRARNPSRSPTIAWIRYGQNRLSGGRPWVEFHGRKLSPNAARNIEDHAFLGQMIWQVGAKREPGFSSTRDNLEEKRAMPFQTYLYFDRFTTSRVSVLHRPVGLQTLVVPGHDYGR